MFVGNNTTRAHLNAHHSKVLLNALDSIFNCETKWYTVAHLSIVLHAVVSTFHTSKYVQPLKTLLLTEQQCQ